MISVRVMPCLLLQGTRLVKTTQFRSPRYLGDPRNAVRIYNEKEVDELVILDIEASRHGRPVQFDLIQEIVSEAFMPVAYGGGLRNIEDARRMLQLGVEKVIFSTALTTDPDLIRRSSDEFGAQSVVACLDVRGGEIYTHSGTKPTGESAMNAAVRAEELGAGEILVNSIDRDGKMEGYDLGLLRSVSEAVRVPVVACGGAGQVEHFKEAVEEGGASAVAAGSMFVYFGRLRGVLINYPEQQELEAVLGKR